MNPRFWIVLAAVALGGVAGVCADPPKPELERVRATVAKLWSKDGEEAAAAVRALEADPLALPVLRREAVADPNLSHRGSLERLLAPAMKARDQELVKRVERWADDGRLDLLTEVRSLTDGEAADAALDRLLRASKLLREESSSLLAARLPKPPVRPLGPGLPWADGAAFQKSGPKPVFDADLAALPEKDSRDKAALFGDRVSVPSVYLRQALVVCRSELEHFSTAPGKYRGCCEWTNGSVFANAGVRFTDARECVLVVDGDLKFGFRSIVAGSVVVVNGSVTQSDKEPTLYIDKSVVWAAGDIELYASVQESVLAAGGKITDADKLAKEVAVEQNAKEPPLPVRFLDPAEYGLTLEATKEGMKVAKVAEKTAFADVLKEGDVITAVTGVKTPTAPAFRRELRRGIIEGAAIFAVTRGKESLELLAAVPDVPPAPKKEKKDTDPKAKPPEKKDDKPVEKK